MKKVFTLAILLFGVQPASADIFAFHNAVAAACPDIDGVDGDGNVFFKKTAAANCRSAAAAVIANAKNYLSAPAVPSTVSAMQAKVALSRAGKLNQANTWVATQNAEVQLIWSTATVFNRNSSLMNSAAAALGWSQADLDALFIAAVSINP